MSAIYEPNGKAREYSPLALNIYTGCDHNCRYCYIQNFITDSRTARPRKNLLEDLRKETAEGINRQVLLCFMSDPYNRVELELGITRQALEILARKNVPVAILTKGGTRIFRDMDIIRRFESIKIGATLTFDNNLDSFEWEPGAALPGERMEMLFRMHNEGIKTWVSIEPVIIPEQSLKLIRDTLGFVDQYKVGRWNHDKRANDTDWTSFGREAVSILRSNGKQFYIKDDLAIFLQGLRPEERDRDALAITSKFHRSQSAFSF